MRFWPIFILSIVSSLRCLALPSVIQLIDLRSGSMTKISTKPTDKLATVFVFLSSECPCSESHQPVLSELAKSHPEFAFVGVHSNSDESIDDARIFFKKAELFFPVVEDTGQKIANELGALKTPHAFVVNPKGEILFRGGVDETHIASGAKKHFLAMALDAIVAGQKPDPDEVAPLGCAISR